MNQIGILHPGAMGVSVAASMIASGHIVLWASDERSEATKARALEHKLVDADVLETVCARAEVIISVCPPHAAEIVADNVLSADFRGLYVDANAISPQKALRIAGKMRDADVDFVDGGIVGGPAWVPGNTWLYISGERADEVALLFKDGALETQTISDKVGKASALKMCYAAQTKGSTALLSLVMAAAEKLDVRDALERQWARHSDGRHSDGQGDNLAEQNRNRVQRVTRKAWRFAGEMDEMVETFSGIGLPSGFHTSAAELYRNMAHFKDADPLPELTEILHALLHEV